MGRPGVHQLQLPGRVLAPHEHHVQCTTTLLRHECPDTHRRRPRVRQPRAHPPTLTPGVYGRYTVIPADPPPQRRCREHPRVFITSAGRSLTQWGWWGAGVVLAGTWQNTDADSRAVLTVVELCGEDKMWSQVEGCPCKRVLVIVRSSLTVIDL